MSWTTPTATPHVTSAYNPTRRHPITGRVQPHTGADYRAPLGTPIRAAAAGTVVRSAYDPPRAAGGTGAGYHVRIDHGGGVTTRYYHLAAGGRPAVGQRVSVGQQIGTSGNTGDSTAAHLHFEVRIGGVATNPVPWLAARVGLVTNPGGGTGTVPDVTIPGPVRPIEPVPEEDIVASLQELDQTLATRLVPVVELLNALARRGHVFRLDVPGAKALYAEVGTSARVWLKTPAEVVALRPAGTIPLPADDPFWSRTVVYAVGEVYRRQGDPTGAAFVLAGAEVDGRRTPTLRHVPRDEFERMGRPLIVDVDPAHHLWSLPTIGARP